MLKSFSIWPRAFHRLLKATAIIDRTRCQPRLSRHLRFERLQSRDLLTVVTTLIDEQVTNDFVSLREAIRDTLDGGLVTFASSLNGATIALDRNLGELAFSKSLTIDASSLSSGITIDAGTLLGDPTPNQKLGDGMRIFKISDESAGVSPHSVTLKNLTLRGGDVTGNGGAISVNDGSVYYDSLASLTLDRCTITGNAATSEFNRTYTGRGGGVYAKIHNAATLTITNSTISGNRAAQDGGGVFANKGRAFVTAPLTTPTISISASILSGNIAGHRGGGLYTFNGQLSQTVVSDTRITGNRANATVGNSSVHHGGGIYAYLFGTNETPSSATFTLTGSTVDNNRADDNGGGLFICQKFAGTFNAMNSTISGNATLNASGMGGGIFAGINRLQAPSHPLPINLRNVTITENVSATGGGFAVPNNTYPSLGPNFTNTIISRNFANAAKTVPNNLVGRIDIANTKNNLVGSGSTILDFDGMIANLGSTNVNPTVPTLNDNPLLAPLANYGGATPTHALLPGSLAINRGDSLLAVDPRTNQTLSSDQRGAGFTRSFNHSSVVGSFGPVDVGAYKLGTLRVTNVGLATSVQGQPLPVPYWFNGANDQNDGDGSGIQLRTVPVGGANTVMLGFSEPLQTISQASLSLYGLKTGNVPTVASGGYFYSTSSNTASWTFYQPLGANVSDQYLLTLADTVTDKFNAPLDGEWTNPFSVLTTSAAVSKFPSGNATAGGAFKFVFTVLPGDATLNNQVDAADYNLWLQNNGMSTTDFTRGDFTGNGIVDYADYSLFRVYEGIKLKDLVFADFNGDKLVDYYDFNILQNNLGLTGATQNQGDTDNDGDVDVDDYAILVRQLGLVTFDYAV